MNKEQESIVQKYDSFISSVANFPHCTKNTRRYISNKNLEYMFRQGKEIFILDGELDPRIYSEIAECLPSDCKLNIICGPYIAVEDEQFLNYYNVLNNNINNWWYSKRKENWPDIHPFFSKGRGNPNIKIFILKFRIFDNWNFCIEKNSNLIYAENQQGELERGEINFFLESGNLAKEGIKLCNQISENFIKEIWNGEIGDVLDLEHNLLFKPFSIFKKERVSMEQIEKEMVKTK